MTATYARTGGGKNPYETRPGFGRRVAYAKAALLKVSADPLAYIYTRKFDDCFEMHDGSAVVWALMREAIGGNDALARGIERMGARVWPHWLSVYEQGQAGDERQLNLFSAAAPPA
jgi:hypothetical protein